jgi:hypothetical protein
MKLGVGCSLSRNSNGIGLRSFTPPKGVIGYSSQSLSTSVAFLGARYWRINVTANQPASGSTVTSMAGVQMHDTDFGPNLCVGGTVGADSESDSNYLKGNAFLSNNTVGDNGSGDRWASGSGAFPHWLSYDFGSNKIITSVSFFGPINANKSQVPYDFDVQFSFDNSTWSTYWSVSSNLASTGFQFFRAFKTTPTYSGGAPHGSHSYWRIAVGATLEAAGLGLAAVAEIEFRAIPNGNQATGGTAASKDYFQTNSTYQPSMAFDNNTSTIVAGDTAARTSGNHWWIRYNFPAPINNSSVRWRSRSDSFPENNIRFGAVQWSDSTSGPWTTAWGIPEQGTWTLGEMREFSDPWYVIPYVTTARYWRIRETNYLSFPTASEVQFCVLGGAAIGGGTPISSSDGGGGAKANAFDGNTGTTWFPSTAQSGEWIGKDFGSNVVVNCVRYKGGGNTQYFISAVVEYSFDGSNWGPAWNINPMPSVVDTLLLSFPNPLATSGLRPLWRLNVNADNGGGGTAITELQMRTSISGPNAIGNGRAYGLNSSTNVVAFAIDGNTGTAWGSATPAIFYYEFEDHKSIVELMIQGYSITAQSPRDFKLQSSPDGITWTDRITPSSQTGWSSLEIRTFT